MAADHKITYQQCTQKIVVNKKRKPKKLGNNIRPVPGYLQCSLPNDLILLQNGGQLRQVTVEGYAGVVNVYLINSCSIDHALTAIAAQYKWNNTFRTCVDTMSLPPPLMSSINSIAFGTSQRNAKLGRLELLCSVANARQRGRFLYNSEQKKLHIDLFDSERDLCAMFLSPLLQYSTTVTCMNSDCPSAPRIIRSSVVDVPYDKTTNRVHDIGTHVQQELCETKFRQCNNMK